MTTDATSGTSVLRIGRVNATYLVPRDHPSPSSVRAQLDAVAERMVAASCARLLGPLCGDGDPVVWFVRSLAVDVLVDAAWEADRLSETWAAQVTRSLVRQMSCGDDGAEVLRFPNRAAWLTQFLRDLAEGVAWSKWYYASLEGLRALPLNAAVRETLCREPVVGEAALHLLAEDGRIEKVLRTLSEADCRSVLEAFCRDRGNGVSPSDPTELLQTAWRIWQRTPLDAAVSVTTHRAALQLYLALRRDGVASSPALPQSLQALLTLVRWMASPQAGPFFAELQRGDTASLLQLARGDDPDSLTALLRYDRSSVIEIAEQIRQSTHSSTSKNESTEAQTRFTPFGGVFYLLPHLVELGLEECASALPEFEGDEPTAVVRFLVLLKCIGAARAPHAFFDPVLRQVAGVSPDLDAESVRVWTRSVTREQAESQNRWTACCRRRGVVGSRFYSVHSVRRGKILLVKDCERGCWLRVERSVAALTDILAALPAEVMPEALLCDPSLMKMLPARIAEIPVCAWNSPKVFEWAAKDEALATCLEHTRSPDDDLNYLSLTTLLRGGRHLDLTLSLAAREVLRSFAWRLPGFAWSSCEYLGTNFLDTNANIEPGAGGWVVRLTRPPLHVVLAMTGRAQDDYQLPWLGDQHIQLTTGES